MYFKALSTIFASTIVPCPRMKLNCFTVRRARTTFVDSAKDLEMIWVEPGTFTMGQTGVANAEPEHNVTLTQGFYLGKYEVTQAQYEAVMTGNTRWLKCHAEQLAGNPDRPVEKVSWEDIQVFLTRLNAQEAGNIPAGGRMYCPRKPSGSMPAGQARPRRTRGEID